MRFDDRGEVAVEDQPPALDHDHAFAERGHVRHVMRGQQDGGAGASVCNRR
jgi:hypothetical protein